MNYSAAPPDPSGNAGHALVTIFPIVEGIALLGELDKWVNVSPNRFSNLVIDDTGLRVDLRGAVGERVRVTVVVEGTVVVKDVWIGADNTAQLAIDRKHHRG